MSIVRRLSAIVAVVVVSAALAGCTADDSRAGAGDEDWRVAVSATDPDGAVSSRGWSVKLGAPAAAGELVLGSAPVTADHPAVKGLAEAAAAARIRAGEPVEIVLTDSDVPAEGVTISRRLERPVAEDERGHLAFWDEGVGVWTPVPTTLSSDRLTLSATVDHLSFWDDFVYGVADVFAERVDPPTCEGAPPEWVDDVVFLDDRNGPVRWCAGADSQRPDVLVVKLALNRAYGAAVTTAVPAEWTWNSTFPSGGPSDVLTQLYSGVLQLPAIAQGSLLVPGGEEAHFAFTEDQVRQAEARPLVAVSADPAFVVAGLTLDALLSSTDDGVAAAIVTMVTAADCSYAFADTVSALDWPGAAGAALGCLTDQREALVQVQARLLAEAVPNGEARDLGKRAADLGRKLYYVWAAGKVFQLAEWANDSQLVSAAWQLSAFPVAPFGAGDLMRQGVCVLPCEVTGRMSFEHPTWGQVELLTTLSTDAIQREANIAVVDENRDVRWSHRGGDWYELAPNNPARDDTGHLLLNYNPGRYNGVIALAPESGGFADFRTLPPPGDYRQRFYSAELRDVDGDGVFEVVTATNDCDPSCADGTVTFVQHRWNGDDYVPRSPGSS